MIIKSMSRKTPSFDKLVNYMLAPDRAQVEVMHNLPPLAQTPERIIQEFTDNHTLLPGRVNGNALFHEIIALEPDIDLPVKDQIKALRKIAQRYLDQRAPNQLALGVIHRETAHLHMHLMISSNAVLSKKRVWMKKKEFAEIQKELEAYQLKHFPELGSARHYDRTSTGLKRGTKEQAASLRTGALSHKEQLAAELKTVLEKSRSREAMETGIV